MARECQLTGKKPMTGNKVSHSNMKSKRRFLPNLQKKSFFIPETGQTVLLNVSTSAIRNIDKLGLYDYLLRLKAEGFHTGVSLRKKK
ncbi:MAG TPA: 50S ribosomal protein L28 [Saprospiraceae bacterium]|nr:50S ribosomal protein L28 [Saprospiraceae bacterium]